MLKSLLIDRRLWLLVLVLTLVLVATRWSLEPQQGYGWVIHGGYWFMLALTGTFLWVVVPMLRDRWAAAGYGRFEAAVGAAILLILGVWFAQDRPGYKVLADELLLSGTAMGLHYERAAAYPIRATDVQGSFQILTKVLDKRPLFFPFLVATVHDLTGYRVENPFYLNLVLAAIFLWLVYLVGWKAGQSRWSGVVALLLFAGLPLLAQQATGGGFELLNLLLLAAFTLLLVVYLEKPEEVRRLEAGVYCALLLASTRYESVIFLPLVGVAALVGWWRAGRVVLSWPLILSPIFLAPVLIQNRMFAGQSQVWEMASLGATEPFGFQYLAPNLGHALAFFFDISGYQPNSPLLAALGLLCLPFLGLWMIRVFRQGAKGDPAELAWSIVSLGLFAITAVYLFYFWGQFDHPVIRRLSLPVHFLLLLAILVIGAKVVKTDGGRKVVLAVVVIGMLCHSLPVMARQAYRTLYSPGMEMQIRKDFLATLTDHNVLFLDNDSFFWILHRMPASPVQQAQARKEGLIYHLRNHSFQGMYVFQSILVDDKTGIRSVDPEDDLGPDFELETVLEKKVQTLLFARISRIKAIYEQGAVAARAEPFVVPLREKRSAEELERARVLYLENWIKQLP